MNYFEIGQRIRTFRKERLWSQEILAEKVGISVTHMSHIETGNTKLSLSVFVSIAIILKVSTDSLLFDTSKHEQFYNNEFRQIVSGCSENEMRIICDIAQATKISLLKE